jgi:AAA family ATP:ADP antiporter
MHQSPRALLRTLIAIRGAERGAVLLATAYGFCILFAYYILRPVRDEISAEDRGNLQLLWTAVFLVMLLAVPAYSALVSRYSRRVFIPLANRFFALNLALFFAALYLLPNEARIWIDRVFYVWTSVFALFVVTIFWGYMADLFRNEQGRRLFGIIAVGASLGAIAGSSLTAALAERVPTFALLLIAMVPLEAAAWLAWGLHRNSEGLVTSLRRDTVAIKGTAFSGIGLVMRSPYLRRIAAYLALMTFASTVLYFQQADLIGSAFGDDRAARRTVFAQIDLAVNVLTILTQLLLTAQVIRWLGVPLSLALTPILVALGFLTLGLYPTLAVLVVFQVMYRTIRYAIARPARELLFTVVGREQRYKSKAFLDAAVYRGGDLASGWIYAGLAALGLSVGAIALLAVPAAVLWAGFGIGLGRRQEERARRDDDDDFDDRAPAQATPRATSV